MHLAPSLVVVLLGLAVSSSPSGADPSVCASRLDVVTRFHPWPAVPEDMLTSLRNVARRPDVRLCVRTRLDDALARDQPDFVLRALLRPGDSRPAKMPACANETRVDLASVRELVAASVAEIRDQTLQRAWMTFFAEDPSSSVRIIARRAFLDWPEQSQRDAFIEDPSLSERERKLRHFAAKTGLEKLSPPVRWRAIKYLVEHLDQVDQDVAAALGTFDDPALLCKWHADTVREKIVLRAIDDTPPVPPVLGDHQRYRAQHVGYALNRIVQTKARVSLINKVTRRASGASADARFARDVLAWESAWALIHREAYDHATGFPLDEARSLAALRLRTPDERSFEIACAARTNLIARGHHPLKSWRDEDLHAFEERLGAQPCAAE